MNNYLPLGKYSLALLTAILFRLASAPALQAKEPVDYVNPFIGAASTRPTEDELARMTAAGVKLDPNFEGFHGKLFPGAATPAGMVQLSPDTITGGDNGAGYSYPHTTIQGFSFNHMSGVGAYGDLGNFMVMPTTGPLKTWYGETDKPGTGYLSSYSKKTEVAQAGYYAVTLDDYQVRAETTAAPHSGVLRFTFSKNPQSRIQIDLARRVGGTSLHQTVKVVGDNVIEGEIQCPQSGGGFRGGTVNYMLYYHAEFSKPLKNIGVWSAAIPQGRSVWNKPEFAAACKAAVQLPGCREKEGAHLGFYAEFPTEDKEVIMLKAGISFVSIAGARANLAAEIPAWDFDGVRQQARELWAKALDQMSVEGGTEDQKTIFYTAIYHSLIDPRICADVNGDYTGGDGQIHHTKSFTKRTIFSGWDVYRSQFPLLMLIAPSIVNDQINSAVELAEQNGTHYYDRWELMGSYTGCMCGSPQVAVINDAYQKGIRNYDLAKAYEYSVNTCDKFGNGPQGYTSTGHGLAITLENAYADWNLAQLATALGHAADAKKFTARGQNYRQLFNADGPWTYDKAGKDAHPEWKGWFQSKGKDGKWLAWEGLLSGQGGMESSVYQTGWFVPQDIPGLMALLGGKDVFIAKLSDFFDRTPKLNRGNPYMEQGNEPSHLIPFLFNRGGAPWLTQKWVRRLVTETYSARPNGLSGDDDVGQMSSWFVLAASGLHQACPGDPRFEIFTPLFDNVIMKFDRKYAKGKSFVITAKNNSPENVYIQSATLNGQPLNRCWLHYSEITAGGSLELVLGPQPNKHGGVQKTPLTDGYHE
jgi:predicted alpha-1,2-mannosidase